MLSSQSQWCVPSLGSLCVQFNLPLVKSLGLTLPPFCPNERSWNGRFRRSGERRAPPLLEGKDAAPLRLGCCLPGCPGLLEAGLCGETSYWNSDRGNKRACWSERKGHVRRSAQAKNNSRSRDEGSTAFIIRFSKTKPNTKLHPSSRREASRRILCPKCSKTHEQCHKQP